jgi:hypothetical protein
VKFGGIPQWTRECLLTTLVSTLIACAVAHPIAQGPQRQQAVRIPGTDIVLDGGWQLLWTADGRCSYAVPAAWRKSDDGRRTTQPDGAITVTVSAIDGASSSAHRAAVKAAMRFATVREDTRVRLWLEGMDGPWAWQHVSVSDGERTCTADIESRPRDRARDVVQKIALSVRVALDGDRQWTKR